MTNETLNLSEALGIPWPEMEKMLDSIVKKYGGGPAKVDDIINDLLNQANILSIDTRKAAAIGYYVALEHIRSMQENGECVDLTGKKSKGQRHASQN